jgi:hypothetical protein
VEELGIQEVLGAPQAPRQPAYIERVVGTIRSECLDHVIVFNEAASRRQLKLFRTHLSLEKDTPESRSVQPSEAGGVVAVSQVGGCIIGTNVEPREGQGTVLRECSRHPFCAASRW